MTKNKEAIEYAIKHFLEHLSLSITPEQIEQAKQTNEPVHIMGNIYLHNVCQSEQPTKYEGCFIKDIRKADDGTVEIDIIYNTKEN